MLLEETHPPRERLPGLSRIRTVDPDMSHGRHAPSKDRYLEKFFFRDETDRISNPGKEHRYVKMTLVVGEKNVAFSR